MLSAVAAAAAGTAANFVAQVSMEDFMQNYLAGFLSTARNMQADQYLERKYFAMEMQIEKESLHREDIRDLMELTIGRMDIYHVVGTLILTFCITWFTDAQILESDLPAWFTTLFLVSNFSAVGYLVLSVWLAMHASIAAHSVGVRLLTSFARLTIPTKEDLKKLRVTLVPKLEEFLAFGRNLGRLGLEAFHRSGAASADVPQVGSQHSGSERTKSKTSQTRRKLGGPNHDGAGSEDMQHFKRFMEEQEKWIGYDAYARVCMSLGMNQMLQALAYYVVGVLAKTNLIGAVAAFFGIKMLAFLLLQLDIAGMCESWAEYFVVLGFMVVPSGLASVGFLVLKPIESISDTTRDLAVTPCFVLHGLWLLYVACDMEPGFWKSGHQDNALPRRIRTVGYLNVYDSQQRNLAEKIRAEEADSLLAPLQAARKDFGIIVDAAMHEEAASGSANHLRRKDSEMCQARERLAEELDNLHSAGAVTSMPKVQNEMRLAQRALDTYDVWDKVPEISASLRALRDKNVREYFSEEQKHIIEQSYQEFLRQCQQLGLALSSETTARSPVGLSAIPEEPTRVRVDTDAGGDPWSGYLPTSVWIDTCDGSVEWKEPSPGVPTTSFATAISREASWSRKVVSLACSMDVQMDGSPPLAAGGDRETEPLSEDMIVSSSAGEQRAQMPFKLIPTSAAPDKTLPARMVRRFTMWTTAWWFISACIHVGLTCFNIRRSYAALPVETLTRLSTLQLEHSAFFEVSSLNCNSSHMLLADQFSLYGALWHPTAGLDSFDYVGHADVATQLTWIRALHGATLDPPRIAPVGVAQFWRIAAPSWEGRPHAQSNGSWLAWWDGASVVVASVRFDAAAGSWHVSPHFKVHPGLGRRTHAWPASWTARNGTYGDVRALHVAPDGGVLIVLLGGGLLDVWELTAGVFSGRWQLGKDYAAICHAGTHLLLARQDEDGPVVDIATLPLTPTRTSRAHGLRFLEA